MHQLKSYGAAIVFSLLSLSTYAQGQVIEKYPEVPGDYNAVFMEHVKDNICGVVKSTYGQYFGQVTPKHEIYGYGSFFTDQNGQAVGQFRNGNCFFGILMNIETAKVGSQDHYTVYDLNTGDPLCVMRYGERLVPDKAFVQKNRFVAMNYQNGDKYIGEIVNGLRDGYGIYYYTNGNFYYGQYKNNKRCGYGCMFRSDNTINLQYWKEGDDQ